MLQAHAVGLEEHLVGHPRGQLGGGGGGGAAAGAAANAEPTQADVAADTGAPGAEPACFATADVVVIVATRVVREPLVAEGVAAHTGFQQLVLAELANLEPRYKGGVLRREGGEKGEGGHCIACPWWPFGHKPRRGRCKRRDNVLQPTQVMDGGTIPTLLSDVYKRSVVLVSSTHWTNAADKPTPTVKEMPASTPT